MLKAKQSIMEVYKCSKGSGEAGENKLENGGLLARN